MRSGNEETCERYVNNKEEERDICIKIIYTDSTIEIK